MSIKFNCQHCNQILEAEDSMQGETLECPNCSNSITVAMQVKKIKEANSKKNEKGNGINKVLIGVIVGIIILFSSYIIFKESGSLKKAISKLTISSDSPEGVLKAYFSAKRWKNRLPYVLDSKTASPLMKKWYGNRVFNMHFVNIEKTDKEIDIIKTNEYINVTIKYVVIDENKKEKKKTFQYWIKKTTDGYKIDWQASMGYNGMTWNAFKAQRVTTPMVFRVNARLADYYNYEFLMKKESYYSICFSDSGLYGFVYKNSPLGEKIFNILKDGEWHEIILKINFSPVHRKSSGIVYIQDLVSSTWIKK